MLYVVFCLGVYTCLLGGCNFKNVGNRCSTVYCNDSAVDVWSVGCIMAELLMGKPLFPGTDRILFQDLK